MLASSEVASHWLTLGKFQTHVHLSACITGLRTAHAWKCGLRSAVDRFEKPPTVSVMSFRLKHDLALALEMHKVRSKNIANTFFNERVRVFRFAQILTILKMHFSSRRAASEPKKKRQWWTRAINFPTDWTMPYDDGELYLREFADKMDLVRILVLFLTFFFRWSTNEWRLTRRRHVNLYFTAH